MTLGSQQKDSRSSEIPPFVAAIRFLKSVACICSGFQRADPFTPLDRQGEGICPSKRPIREPKNDSGSRRPGRSSTVLPGRAIWRIESRPNASVTCGARECCRNRWSETSPRLCQTIAIRNCFFPWSLVIEIWAFIECRPAVEECPDSNDQRPREDLFISVRAMNALATERAL